MDTAPTPSKSSGPSAVKASCATPTPLFIAATVNTLVPASFAVIVTLVVSVESMERVVESNVAAADTAFSVAVAEPRVTVRVPAVATFTA